VPKISIANPRKVKELSLIAQRCFEKIIGEPPNDQFRFHTPEQVEYVFDILSTMVRGHLKEITQEQFDLRNKQWQEKQEQKSVANKINSPKVSKANEKTQKIPFLKIIGEAMKKFEFEKLIPNGVVFVCPRCGNEEFESHHNFCKICGLPKPAIIGGQRDEQPS
jgi:ribosomal protein L37E